MSGYARAFFAVMVGIIVIIGTTASNFQVPTFYWIVSALCVSMRRLAEEARRTGFETAGIQSSTVATGSAERGPSPAHSLRKAQELQNTAEADKASERPCRAKSRQEARQPSAKYACTLTPICAR